MKPLNATVFSLISGFVLLTVCLCSHEAMGAQTTYSSDMKHYCVTPPFLSSYVPPQVLFTMGKDHKFYYPAYNDASDINEDGKLETGYKHSFDYYGYFDSNKCYSYSSGVFVPFGTTSDKYCSSTSCTDSSGAAIDCSGKFSGNFLNWVAMSRADVVKMVIYGGYRTADNMGANYAELSGEYIPQDGHIWGKEYLGSDAPKLFAGGVADKRALFCVNGITTSNLAQLKILPDVTQVSGVTVSGGLRAWHWINVNGNADICGDGKIDTDGNGIANSATLTGRANYKVTVRACDPSTGYNSVGDWETKHCKNYSTSDPQDANGPWRPVGLMQIYGEGKKNAKVCSMDMATPCTNDNGCTSNGQCVDAADMYFGLIAGSFKNPRAGGYLRKAIYSMNEETNDNGILQGSASSGKGILMKSIEAMKCPATYPLTSHTGNPIAEIMYEGLRYWSGRGSPTSAFVNNISAGNNGDNNNYASMPSWDTPAALYPSCSIPFTLVFSDIYNSYDHDQVPGSAFATVSGDLTDFNASDLANTIWSNENLGTPLVTGESGTTVGANTDGRCGGKSVSGLGSIKGLCPAEGGQSGTFYPASVALYGHNSMDTKMKTPNVLTYVVAFNSNVPEIKVVTNSGKTALVAPYGKSISSTCTTTNTNFPVSTLTTSGGTVVNNLAFMPKDSTSSCATQAQVSFYVLETEYDSSNNLKYIKYRVATDDVGGGDFDLDMLTEYTVCAHGANNSACSGLASDQVSVKTERIYSAADNMAALGFTIANVGSTDSGSYLVVEHARPDSGILPSNMGGNPGNPYWATHLPNSSETLVFTAQSGNATLPKPPLWYAAKYGGFKDADKDGLPYTDATCSLALSNPGRNPKCNEWSSKNPGVPDTYFEVSNPSKMEQRLRDALDDILARVSSGTAASILNNSEGSGASLLQAVFYPKKGFDNDTEASWIGEMHNMWYYIDPYLKLTSIREDSNSDYKLNLKNDRIAQFVFIPKDNKTVVQLYDDADGDGSPDSTTPDDTVLPEDLKSLWKAGRKLWERNLTTTTGARTIYTHTGSSGLSTFSTASKTALRPYLQAADDAEAENIIKYIHGFDSYEIDSTSPPNYRNRTITINNCGLTDSLGCTRPWKLGDIVSSTPKLVSNVNLNSYANATPNGYADSSYKKFTQSSTYKGRGMVFVGGNDGMLHAFKLGLLKELNGRFDKAQFNNASGSLASASDNLGREEWSFIPKQALPYLKYLTDIDYDKCHLFFVDKTPTVADVNLEKPSGCSETNYWDCAKPSDGTNWRTILIGGSGLGGAPKWNGDGAYTAPVDSVKTPVKGTSASDSLGYSSYFALDVTDPTTPAFKWEFPGTNSSTAFQQLGYATTGPAIVRISAKIKDGADDTTYPNHAKNGRWFAVFASGPTGPIDINKKEFKGGSDQQLRIFVVDMADGTLVRTINTFADGTPFPAEAFAGSLATSWLDSDRATPANKGWYSDDAIYVGYTRKCDTSKETGCENGTWTRGGVIRLLTKELIDPAGWAASHLIKDIGPVTTSVTKLQDRRNKNLWIYLGTGRYFYKNDTPTDQQVLYGIKDPCYVSNKMNGSCTDSVDTSKFVDQSGSESTAPAASLADDRTGWYITLDTSSTGYSAERVITDPLASTAGAVFFTTFVPSNAVCKFGGDTYIWALRYDTGGIPPGRAMQGKALMQVSTGAFAEISLKDAFKSKDGNQREEGRKLNVAISGVPPTAQGLSLITNPPPVKKILHVREK